MPAWSSDVCARVGCNALLGGNLLNKGDRRVTTCSALDGDARHFEPGAVVQVSLPARTEEHTVSTAARRCAPLFLPAMEVQHHHVVDEHVALGTRVVHHEFAGLRVKHRLDRIPESMLPPALEGPVAELERAETAVA